MSDQNEFPLIVWEKTDEFKQEYGRDEQRFHDIKKRLYQRGFQCTFLGDLRMNRDGFPEVWLNDNHNLYRRNWIADEAVEHAKIHGDSGWWSLDFLEQFEEGKGPIFENAMYDLGFRKNKKDSTKWARLTSEYKEKMNQRKTESFREQIEKEWPLLTENETDRLNQLWTRSNENAGLNNTYSIGVGQRGLIYVSLDANPFSATSTEQLSWFCSMLKNRGHISKQQKGFYIDARNVKLGMEKGIHIKAINSLENYVECVWPHKIPEIKLDDLADDLVSRVNQ